MLLRRLLFAVLLCVGAAPFAAGQPAHPARVAELMPTAHIVRNSVSNLHTAGDSLWVGPLLNVTWDGGATWQQADADSLVDGRGRVFSLDIEGETIWVGLGFSQRVVNDGRVSFVQTAGGFVFSTDGGRTWTYRPPPLDALGDSLQPYGVSVLPALPVIVPEQSPPFDIDIAPGTGTVWTAGWASGLRRSDDAGLTWQRVVLPPDTLDEIRPDVPYSFPYSPRQSEDAASLNFSAFSVLVDETGTVWAGTAGGLNRSTDGGVAWRRYDSDDLIRPLAGDWVISIEEQPLDGRNPVWFTTWRAEDPAERFGLMVTRDGGETFETTLLGERLYDTAFRGETVYAAGENGLFISEDGGRTWSSVSTFVDRDDPERSFRPGVTVFAVATTPTALWAGTADGLARSLDGGRTWSLFRADVPLDPDTPTAETPRVDAYAYPNPFSPTTDGLVRIRYALDDPGAVTLRIFDFGMNLIRVVTDEERGAGPHEARWDGLDDRGMRLPNGAYFYAVETDAGTTWGKILVLE